MISKCATHVYRKAHVGVRYILEHFFLEQMAVRTFFIVHFVFQKNNFQKLKYYNYLFYKFYFDKKDFYNKKNYKKLFQKSYFGTFILEQIIL